MKRNSLGRGEEFRFDATRAALLLAGALCTIPFLQPRHLPPIRTFYEEWLAVAFALGATGLLATARRPHAVRVTPLVLWLCAFSLYLAARAVDPNAAYVQSTLIWALYVLFAAMLVCLGQQLAVRLGREQVCETIAAFLLVGSLVNAAAGILQVVGIPPFLDDFVAYLHGQRAVGNVGQANLYANYLALGVASLLFLHARGRLGVLASSAGALMLLSGSAVATSRSTSGFLLIFLLLACIMLVRNGTRGSGGFFIAVFALAALGVLLQIEGPNWLQLLGNAVGGDLHRDPALDAAFGREFTVDLRLHAWKLAWEIFASNPWFGVGPGQFAGAAFDAGLTPEMAAEGVWTSPHNLLLQLLAETGLVGALIVGTGLTFWVLRVGAEFMRHPDPASWWIMACVGVGFAHATFEYPFWYAHFLGITALVMGVGATRGVTLRAAVLRTWLAAGAVTGFALLAVVLKEYLRFEQASPVSAGRSLAPDADVMRDRATLLELSGSLLAPRAEMWLFLAFPLEARDLEQKVAAGERLLRVWPSEQVVARQSVFLAMAGRHPEGRALLGRGMNAFVNHRAAMSAVVSGAPAEVQESLRPMLR